MSSVLGKLYICRGALSALLLLCVSGCCDSSAIPAQTKKLYSSNAKERNQAALDLARCGEKASAAVPRLSALLYDENVGVQSSASYALREIDTPDARAAIERAMAAKEKRRQSRAE